MFRSKLINCCIFFVYLYLFLIVFFVFVNFELSRLNKTNNFNINIQNNNISWKHLEYKWVDFLPVLLIKNVTVTNSDFLILIDRCVLNIDIIKSIKNSNWSFSSVYVKNMSLNFNDFNYKNQKNIPDFSKYINKIKVENLSINNDYVKFKVKDLIGRFYKEKINLNYTVKYLLYNNFKFYNIKVNSDFKFYNGVYKLLKVFFNSYNSGYIKFKDIKFLNIKNKILLKDDIIQSNADFDFVINNKFFIPHNNINLKGNYNLSDIKFRFNYKNSFGEIKNIMFFSKNNKNILRLKSIDTRLFNKYLKIFDINNIKTNNFEIVLLDIIWKNNLIINSIVKNLSFNYDGFKFFKLDVNFKYKNKILNVFVKNDFKSSISSTDLLYDIKLNKPIYINKSNDMLKISAKELLYNKNKFSLFFIKKLKESNLSLSSKKFLWNDISFLLKNYINHDGIKDFNYLDGSVIKNIKIDTVFFEKKMTRLTSSIHNIDSIDKLKNLILHNIKLNYTNKLKFTGYGLISNSKFSFLYDKNFSFDFNGNSNDIFNWLQKNKFINNYKFIDLKGNILAKLKLIKDDLIYYLSFKDLTLKSRNHIVLNKINGKLFGNKKQISSKNLNAFFYDIPVELKINNTNKNIIFSIFSDKFNLNRFNGFCKKDCHFIGSCFARMDFTLDKSLNINSFKYKLTSDLKGLGVYVKNWFTKTQDSEKKLIVTGEFANNLNSFNISMKDVINVVKNNGFLNVLIGNNVPLYLYSNKNNILINLPTVPDVFWKLLALEDEKNNEEFFINAFFNKINVFNNSFSNVEFKINNLQNDAEVEINSNDIAANFKIKKDYWVANIDYWKFNYLSNAKDLKNLSLFNQIDLKINKLMLPGGDINNIKAKILKTKSSYKVVDLLVDESSFLLSGDLLLNQDLVFNGKLHSNNFSNIWFLSDYLKYLETASGDVIFNIVSYNFKLANLFNNLNGVVSFDLENGKIKITDKDLKKQLRQGKAVTMLSPENIFNNFFVDDWSKNNFYFNKWKSNLIIRGTNIFASSFLTSSIADINFEGDINNYKNINLLFEIKPKISSSIPALAALSFGAPVGAFALIFNKMFVEGNVKPSYFRVYGDISSPAIEQDSKVVSKKAAVKNISES